MGLDSLDEYCSPLIGLGRLEANAKIKCRCQDSKQMNKDAVLRLLN
jgi:hypothetical protein